MPTMTETSPRHAAPEQQPTPDDLYRGVVVVDTWDSSLSEKDGAVFDTLKSGHKQQLPTGILLRVWTRHDDGEIGDPHMMYVDKTEGVQVLRRDEHGDLPKDVTHRMDAERDYWDSLRPAEPKVVYPSIVRVGNQFMPLHSHALTKQDSMELNRILRAEDKQAAQAAAAASVAALKVRAKETLAQRNQLVSAIRNLATIALLGKQKQVGRHHVGKPRLV